jgi:transcriptional regulator with XRE-family HTH domain
MSEINRELGALVREYRAKKTMTQLELANRLGYESVQFVSLFERGLAKIPVTVLGKLIIILGIPEKRVTNSLVDVFVSSLQEQIQDGKRSVS